VIRIVSLWVSLCLVLVATSVALLGQASAINGQITGTVLDGSGAAIGGATVRIANVNTGYTQEGVTTSTGLYRFALLPLGSYEVTAEAQGFGPAKRVNIPVNAGATVTIDFALAVSAVSTEVIVTDAAPAVDPSRIDLGSTLSNNAIVNLPLVSRNPFNFILQQPNVSGRGNTEFGVPRKVNANGFNGRINYQLDGSNNVQSDRAGIRLMPVSNTWVEEVQQVNNGFAPEFGNTVGTVFNTITKSGSNRTTGEAGYIFRRTPFSAAPALLAPGRPAPDVNVDSLFGNVGGKLVKDKLFWFGAYERVNRDLPNPVAVSPANLSQLGLPASFADAIPFRQEVTFFMGKLDWQINDANRLSIRYNGHRNDSPFNGGGGLTLIDRTFKFVDRSHGVAAQLISVLSSRSINEFRFQTPYRSQQNQVFEGSGTGPAISIAGVANFGAPVNAGFNYTEVTPEISNNFSHNLSTHSLKFGVNWRTIRDTNIASTFATFTFPNVAAYLAARDGSAPRGYANFQQTLGEPRIEYNSHFTSLFAQDSWKPRANLTITYGLRYDLYVPPQANTESPFEFSRSFRVDRNNFAPRVGVAWGLGKTVLRASGGFFFDPFQTDVYRRALLNNGTPQFFNVSLTPTNALAPNFPDVFAGTPSQVLGGIRDINTVSPDFANLYSGNANVSISRELGSNFGITATYLFTRGNRLPIYRNINLGLTGNTLADGRPIFGGTRPFAGFANILSTESVGQSVYNGLNVTLTKRYSGGLEFFGTWTWSHAIDDAPEQNNIDSGAFLLSDPTNRRRDRGPSLSDRRHAFNANAVWNPSVSVASGFWGYLLNNNRFSVANVIQSGEVFNVGSNRILNGDPSTGVAFQRPLFLGRNTLRAPGTWETNMRYSRIFPIGERLRPEFFAESTNIFNRTNVTDINAAAQVDAQGMMTAPPPQAWTAALDQRLIQFGIKFVF
jgi:hypothetical protein